MNINAAIIDQRLNALMNEIRENAENELNNLSSANFF
ncbi:hypothetical protein BegalDRAFT_1775 [Beggiatoa alba B18LD]|uniref:Uncharacterized protein n=1 Tax=Beggiatoa alba B18LD TaxID=395493 RepID=I3CGA8_9GAMM|nr:hypothetical protein BegalDRAFT_1775 [Beggiatoa alba B18LD]